ncbi:MAG: serine hydrolase [Patescibacteria group bacterium]
MKKFRVLIFLIFFGLGFSLTANASSLNRSVWLNETAINSGYTLKNPYFSIGVQGKILKEPARVYFRQIKKKNLAKKNIALPDNLNLVSKVFVYNIKLNKQEVLAKPLWLSLKFKSKSNFEKNLYYYNRHTQTWVKISEPAKRGKKRVRTDWSFPYSIVAVFEDPNSLMGPIKKKNFVSYNSYANAASAIVIDENTGQVLYERNASSPRSIASLTKMMTAMIFLDSNPVLDKIISYNSAFNREGARLYIDNGETLTLRDVFYTMLVGSANNCAITLANNAGFSQGEFVNKMNDKARELGLSNTHFADPSGLDPNNKSTTQDYAIIAKNALKYFEILKASTTKNYSFTTINTQKFHSINNTNQVLNWDLYITGGKTGYLDEAMYCLMIKAKQDDHEVIAVTLGNPNRMNSFYETYNLAKWALNNYNW